MTTTSTRKPTHNEVLGPSSGSRANYKCNFPGENSRNIYRFWCKSELQVQLSRREQPKYLHTEKTLKASQHTKLESKTTKTSDQKQIVCIKAKHCHRSAWENAAAARFSSCKFQQLVA